MARRAPIQVVVLPFRQSGKKIEYAIFRRSDDRSWQGIAGGGNEGETLAETVRRESREEAQIPETAKFYRLQSQSTVPIKFIEESKRRHWPQDLFVIPNYAFGVDCTGIDLKLSKEHTRVRWVSFKRAEKLLKWDNNKVALWELNERISKDMLGCSTKR